jgi:hypothetical protein
MNLSLETLPGFSKDSMDTAMKSFGALSHSVQAIAAETADYSKKSFEHGAETLEKMLGAKSLDKAVELQSDYLKASYESFIAQSQRLSELYGDLAKQVFKPLEGFAGKFPASPFTSQAGS